jgi:hypothetical protein
MHFGDHGHDGKAAAFYLQTGAGPRGHTNGVVVGLSRSNARQHVFGAASRPGTPLCLREHEWEALLKASGPIDVLDWACGDHGAETQIRLRLYWTPKGIDGISRDYTCPPTPKRLIRQKPLSVD